MESSGKRRAATGRLLVISAVLVLGGLTFAPSPAVADEWVKNDMGKGYDANAQGGLYSVALGDGDRDGRTEVYASCYDNGHVYQYRRENLKWTVSDLGVLWGGRNPRADAILVGDGDDDGKTEVYASGYMYTTSSLINSVYQLVLGTGGWTKTDIGSSGGWGMDLALGDGNRDGRVELYSADADGHIYQYSKGNAWNVQDIGGSPPFSYNNNWFTPYMKGVKVGDADNDGKVEVYGASTDNHVYRFVHAGQGWERTDLGTGQVTAFPLYGLLGLVIGDADNDGKNEIYASSYYNASVWRFKLDPASGLWNISKTFHLTGTMTANDLCIGDGNSDGKNELYVGTSNKQLYEVWLEDGTWKNGSVGSGNGAVNGVAVGSVTDDKQVNQLFAASGDGHCYEFYQDLVPPANPIVWSDTHPETGKWYDDRRVHVLWEVPGCDLSGIDGFSTAWDGDSATVPDWMKEYEESTRDIFTTLGDGCWYFHIRVRDNALNWNESASHYGPVFIDTTSPDFVQVAIDGGAPFTGSRFVSLSMNATDPSPGSGIAGMAFSNDGANWSAWEPYCTTRAGWDLTDPAIGGNSSDGTKTVFARVRDGVGRETPADRVARSAIFLDRRAPEGLSLSVNGSANYTSSPEVGLEVAAFDPEPGSGLARMAFSNDGNAWSDWMDFSSRTTWSLNAGAGGSCPDGEREVFFRVQDRAGNAGGPVSATVLLDRDPPGRLRLIVAGGARYTNSPEVELEMPAADPGPGSPVSEMSLSNSESAPGGWQPFNAQTSRWSLTSGPGGTDVDGEKKVHLWVRDAAGNVGGPVNDTIFLDRVRPGPLKVTVNSGAPWTNSPEVELLLEATDTAPSSGVQWMQLSPDGTTWGEWEAFSPKKHCSLTGPDGIKTVHFRVKDRAGNVAGAVNASLLLDSTPPTLSNLTVSMITNESATITWTTDEPAAWRFEHGVGPVLDRCMNSSGLSRNHTVRLTGLFPSTTYLFRVTSTDEHSNTATTSSDLNFTTLRTYTPPPKPRPASRPAPAFPWAWAAAPLLAAVAAGGLFIVVSSRRRRARAPPPVPRRSDGLEWDAPAAASPAPEEAVETLAMDEDPPAAAPSLKFVRCTSCGTPAPVLATARDVQIICPGCGKVGTYRGPRTG